MENSYCPKTPIGYWGYNCCKGTCPECKDCTFPDLDVYNREIDVTYSQYVIKKLKREKQRLQRNVTVITSK